MELEVGGKRKQGEWEESEWVTDTDREVGYRRR